MFCANNIFEIIIENYVVHFSSEKNTSSFVYLYSSDFCLKHLFKFLIVDVAGCIRVFKNQNK